MIIFRVVFVLVVVSLNGCSRLIDTLTDKNIYDKRVRAYNKMRPSAISLDMYILRLGPFTQKEMTFDLSFYFRLRWNDQRMIRNGSIQIATTNDPPSHMIWVPDISVTNALSFDATEGYTRVYIKTNGDVFTSERFWNFQKECQMTNNVPTPSRFDVRAPCAMDLRNYPMDTQTCNIILESSIFSWNGLVKAFYLDSNLAFEEYTLLRVDTDKTLIARKTTSNSTIEPFSKLYARFVVKRTVTYFFTKAYIPTMLLVVFNLGSYWIPDTAESARISLIITTFLSNMFIFQSVTDETVQVNFLTAMQIFMLVNMGFIMVSIIQYLAIIHFKANKERLDLIKTNATITSKHNDDVARDQSDGLSQQNIFSEKVIELVKVPLLNTRGTDVHILDAIFRPLMFFSYALFIIVYFVYYLYVAQKY